MSAPLTLSAAPTAPVAETRPASASTGQRETVTTAGTPAGSVGVAPAPGLYPGVPAAEYHVWPAISASLLKTYLGRSPLHARHEQQHRKASAEMSLGTALHAALLEPDVYARTYVPRWRATGKDSRKTINPARIAALAASGQIELDEEDRDAVEGMRDAVLAHPVAGPLVRDALARELSVAWVDAETGAPCKARFDLVAAGGPIGDLKTCRDASWRAFQRDIVTYGYATQAAHYLAGAAAVAGGYERAWLWIAVESEPPHGVAVYEPDEELLRIGWAERQRALALHLECERTGSWPGYPSSVQTIRPPKWMRSDEA